MTWDISRTRATGASAGWRIARVGPENKHEVGAHWACWPNGAESLSVNLRSGAEADALEQALAAILRLRYATLSGSVRTLSDAADLLDEEA